MPDPLPDSALRRLILSGSSPALPGLSRHGEFIAQSIPDWLLNAAPHRREALKKASGLFPESYQQATAAQQETLRAAYQTSFTSQSVLDKAMLALQDIDTYTRTLLRSALLSQQGISLDVDTTFLRLRKPITLGVLGVEVGSFEVLTLTLLQAAQHNFEASEGDSGVFHSTSGFFTAGAVGGQYQRVDTSLTVTTFIGLCRTLDVGAQYQTYLKDFLHKADADTALRQAFIASQKDALRAAAEFALFKKDIEPAHYTMIEQVIGGELNPVLNGKPVWFRDLGVMKKKMVGCLMFDVSEQYRYSSEVILYIPNDPQHPLKHYTAAAFEDAFKQRLVARDASLPRDGTPTAYQTFFSQFVAHADRPYYFSQFTQAAGSSSDSIKPLRSPWAELLLFKNPISAFVTGNQLPPPKAPKLEPDDDPYVPITSVSRPFLWSPNTDVWDYLYDSSHARLIEDARSQAVPTADIDARVRAEKIGHLLQFGMLLLNGVSMFVPVLGEVMIAVLAGQLLYETFEGAVEWSEGDRKSALGHLTDVAENLVLIGITAGAGKGIGKLLSVKPVPFVEGLEPVTLPNGNTRLWKPDLTPYKATVRLAPDSAVGELGLHRYNGQDVLALDEGHFVVRQEPGSGEHRIQHPARPEAYAPRLQHNGAGGWVHEAENPLAWDGPTLMKRLGHRADTLSPQQLEQIRTASGVHNDTLRRMYIEQEPVPLLMADTLQRFRLEQEIGTFIDQIGSADPQVYAKADPGMQFQVMRQRGLLPASPALRVLDSQGRLLWEDPVTQGTRKGVVLTDRQLAAGEMLEALLAALYSDDAVLEPVPGTPCDSLKVRADELRRHIAWYADSGRTSLFEQRYRDLSPGLDSGAQRLLDSAPDLPPAIANRLLQDVAPALASETGSAAASPPALDAQARWLEQETRVSRAYEGLYLKRFSQTDSHRLVLHSLEKLPGWPDDLALELRQYAPDGRLLDRVGPADARVRKTLVQGVDGDFTGSASGDVYGAIWAALTREQQAALGFTQPAELEQAILAAPLPRESLRPVLLEHPLRKPAYDPRVRLRGGGYAPLGQTHLPVTRVRKLYPAWSDEQIRGFLLSLGNDVQRGLAQREADYALLKKELNAWVVHREAAGGLDGALQAREVAQQLKGCWRQVLPGPQGEPGGNMLKLAGVVDLPELSADFSHVKHLDLEKVSFSSDASTFLKAFPQLEQLRLNQAQLPALPTAVNAMKRLTRLELRDNRIALTEAAVSGLSQLPVLEELSLAGNPLAHLPNLKALTRLQRLDLGNTRLSQWPLGLESLDLKQLDLSQNRLTEVPDNLLEQSGTQAKQFAQLNMGTLLEGNPLTEQANTRLWDYRRWLQKNYPDLYARRRPGAFGVRGPWADRLGALYPAMTLEEAEALLPLSLNNVEAERRLVALEQEWQSLQRDLDGWAADNENGRAEAVMRIEQCWRRAAPDHDQVSNGAVLKFEHVTQVPSLRGDFSHVRELHLRDVTFAHGADDFLRSFSQLERLVLDNRAVPDPALTMFPPSILAMNKLKVLELPGNGIGLTARAAERLVKMSPLERLSLDNNPLVRPRADVEIDDEHWTLNLPDFSALKNLKVLDLRGTKLRKVPEGLDDLPLERLDLRDNAITDLPDSQFKADPSGSHQRNIARNKVTFMEGNPLSDESRKLLAAYGESIYRTEPKALLGVLPGSLLERSTWLSKVRELYPDMTEAETTQVFGPEAEAGLRQLALRHTELKDMMGYLKRWVAVRQNTPGYANLDLLMQRIEACWRRRTANVVESVEKDWKSYELSLTGIKAKELPVLSADFSHVGALNLSQMGLDVSPTSFLFKFPELRWLNLGNNNLTELPISIDRMTELTRLYLSRNKIVLTPQTAAMVGRLAQLKILTLGDNPLGVLPSFNGLPDLRLLQLSNTGIEQWPRYRRLWKLERVEIQNNRIQTFPDWVVRLRPNEVHRNNVTQIYGNPFTEQARLTLSEYWENARMMFGQTARLAEPYAFKLDVPPAPAT